MSTPTPSTRINPSEFLADWPHSILYYHFGEQDRAQDFITATRFDPQFARQKQLQGWNLSFSVNGFPIGRITLGEMIFRCLALSFPRTTELNSDRRWLDCVPQLPLTPQQVLETRTTYELLYRVKPLTNSYQIEKAFQLEQAIACRWGAIKTYPEHRFLPIPSTYQFCKGESPFLTRLVWNEAKHIPSYPINTFQSFLS